MWGIIVLCLNLIQGQVNTEVYRQGDKKQGFQNRANLNLGFQGGNTEFFTLDFQIRSDYYQAPLNGFLVIFGEQKRKDQHLFANKGFAHLRCMRALTKGFTLEAFTQQGYDDFISLKSRQLLGFGLRTSAVDLMAGDNENVDLIIHIGNGLMWEKEELTLQENHTTRLLRSTNYLTLNWFPSANNTILSTTYYQFDVRNVADFRILSNINWNMQISQRLELSISFDYRYDNEPPTDRQPYDLKLTNGITLSF